jgi:DNA-binding NtrC family response regulator
LTPKPNILAVDDEEGMRELLKAGLGRKGCRVVTAGSAEEALQSLSEEPFDLVITDLRLPGLSGEELVPRLKREHPDLPVVVISGFGSTKNVVEVIKRGAEDYLPKPFTPEDLEVVVLKALEKRRLLEENARLRRELGTGGRRGGLMGKSRAVREVLSLLERLAPSDATVLITGESGTGKELAARAIHDRSSRARGPFVEVNSGSLPSTLFEAELFGARKGAYTGANEDRDGLFQAAQGGTLFLDEVGEVPLESQAKLLRALESHEIKPLGESRSIKVDVRVVAATNQELQKLVDNGKFRKDLFFRLSVLPLRMPALRERLEDLPMLAETFLASFAPKGGQPKRVSPEGMKALLSYSWPGNVRELRNMLERSALLAPGDSLEPSDFLFSAGGDGSLPAGNFQESKRSLLEAFERQFLVQALKAHQGNVSRAAADSGLAREQFHRLMDKHQLKSADFKKKG